MPYTRLKACHFRSKTTSDGRAPSSLIDRHPAPRISWRRMTYVLQSVVSRRFIVHFGCKRLEKFIRCFIRMYKERINAGEITSDQIHSMHAPDKLHRLQARSVMVTP